MNDAEQESVNNLITLLGSLTTLTENQAKLIAELNRQNVELNAQIEAMWAISRAKL